MQPKEQKVMKNKKGRWECRPVWPAEGGATGERQGDAIVDGHEDRQVCEKGGEAAIFVPISTRVSSNDRIPAPPCLPVVSTSLFWASFIHFPFLFYSKCDTISEVISASSSLP